MTTLRDILLSEILPSVEKPSRYLGNELHSVHKDPASVKLRIALFFPDVYELGLGNLGLHLLYHLLNGLEDVWAERAYTPAPDLEAVLRKRGLPLFLHESKEPLGAADAVGFSLQSELTWVNVLNAMDLAGFPVRSAERADDAPLFFAGGPTATNPEPLSPFLDFFVMGDGEEAVVEIARALLPLRGAPRRRRLEAVAAVPGVYVPALHPVEMVDGRPFADARVKVTRRVVGDLDRAPVPEKYIVPYTQLVHDGLALEVLRGCTQGCRFCHAGMTTRPVRECAPEAVAERIGGLLDATGLEAATLVSLSTCDHSRVRELVGGAMRAARGRNASVSLPSLRLDSFAVGLADFVSGVRRSGLTFAPEAATDRLRAVINKNIPDAALLAMTEEVFQRGWEHVKLYFMIGLPTETEEDVLAIADLCARMLAAGRRFRRDGMLRTGVSTFVPKPHTPFQYAEQLGLEETFARQRLLGARLRDLRGVKFGRHAPAASFIEGLLSRGGREVADLLERAWRNGAGYETWEERLRIEPWQQALEETGLDPAVLLGPRDPGARLPWDHIDTRVDPAWLREEWARALRGEPTPDCRGGDCNLCGVSGGLPGECVEMRRRGAAGAEEEAPPAEEPPALPVEAVQRMRFRIGRRGEARLLSHLETAQAWIRALRRARLPLAYTQGFHAHPRVTFSTAAPLGEESRGGDFMDVILAERVDPETARGALAAALPPDFSVADACDVPLKAPSLMAAVAGFDYELHTRADAAALAALAGELMARDTLPLNRKVKRRSAPGGRAEAELDIRPMLHALYVEAGDDDTAVVHFSTRLHAGRLAKPKEILQLLGLDPAAVRIVKTATLLAETEVPDAGAD